MALLQGMLASVTADRRGGRPGRAVLIRGRRRVGKSRLLEEFVERAGVPHVFFTAIGGSREEDLAGFAAEVASSSLPGSDRFEGFATPKTRYRIDDPYLRFWLSFIGSGIPAVERGRGDRVLASIRASWTSWRGRAIEPVIREALWRMSADDEPLPGGTNVIGGYWTRTDDPEIDIVGADRSPIAKKITLVGSVKWLENTTFDHRDLARLITHRSQLPGADEDTPMLAVSRSGCVVGDVLHLTPEDLMRAWAPS